jgi:hypothetical protein
MSTVTSQAFVPSTLAIWIMLILNTLPLDAALLTSVVADVVESATVAVLPVIVATFTTFGAAIDFLL